jgi:hypothetical protein
MRYYVFKSEYYGLDISTGRNTLNTLENQNPN